MKTKGILSAETDLQQRSHKLGDGSIRSAGQSPDADAFSRLHWWAGVVLILYVLSIGPVVKLASEDMIPMESPEAIYAPMVWLCETPIGKKFVRPGLIWYGEKIWRWELPGK